MRLRHADFFIIEHPTRGTLRDLEETDSGRVGRFSWSGSRNDPETAMRFASVDHAKRALARIDRGTRTRCVIRGAPTWEVVHEFGRQPRKPSPVHVTTQVDAIVDLRRQRTALMSALRTAEWQFDHGPTQELADQMATTRDAICNLEQRIIDHSMDSDVTSALARMDKVLAGVRDLGGGAV